MEASNDSVSTQGIQEVPVYIPVMPANRTNVSPQLPDYKKRKETTMKTWTRELTRIGACNEAVEWANQYDSMEEAWANCERGNWMLWLQGKLCGGQRSKSRKTLVLAACQCARLALPYVPNGENRPLHAIETAEKWARGEGVTLQQVKAASYAASNAAYASYASYASNASYASYASNAADAADASYAAAYAAYASYAAHAAHAAHAAYDTAYASYAAAKHNILKQCADIVRGYYPDFK